MITLDAAKEQVNIPASDATHDTELQAYVDAVTAVVERQTGEVVTPQSFTERHDVAYRRADRYDVYRPHVSLVLQRHPVISLTSVARVDGTQTWNVADLDVDPSGLVRVQAGAQLYGLILVTYQAGYSSVPPAWALAARFIVQHLWKTQRGSSGPRMGGADADTIEAGMATVPRDVWMLLGDQPPVVA